MDSGITVAVDVIVGNLHTETRNTINDFFYILIVTNSLNLPVQSVDRKVRKSFSQADIAYRTNETALINACGFPQ